MLYRRTVLAGVLAALALGGAACAQDPAVDASGRPLEPLTIVTASGQHEFLVEIADEDPKIGVAALNRDIERIARYDLAQYQWTYKRYTLRPPGSGEVNPYADFEKHSRPR